MSDQNATVRGVEPPGSAGDAGVPPRPSDPFDDTMFDVSAVELGAWVPGPYGPGDERGTFNEVTPEKTARTLALLNHHEPVVTYSLAEVMVEGFPAWSDRTYQQQLVVTGYSPSDDFGGILTRTQPRGRGRMSAHEERVALTYNMGTKINGLHHVGVGDMFYNGFLGPDIARTWGTTHLGAETMGPIVTRGVLVDVVGCMVAEGRSEAYEIATTGRPHLRSNYRITVEDIETALAWESVGTPIGPGDVVLLRTGYGASSSKATLSATLRTAHPDPSCESAAIWPNDARLWSGATLGASSPSIRS